jgi:hypothetical protein
MTRVARGRAIGGAALCLLSMPLVRLLWVSPPDPPDTVQPRRVSAARSPAEAALGQARRFWTQAKIAANEERDALIAWDPRGTTGIDREAWRLGLISGDRGGFLRKARAAVQKAAALARTPDDAWRAAEMRVLVEYGAGDSVEGLRQARILVTLRPRSPRSWMVLRVAALRAERAPLVQQANAALAVLESRQHG